ncbi:hypothetical protein O0I10_007842 [Lichtheimia ornata]|uniref:Amino acid transporter transmembrane domain-containing protein n=1 Tax=Lichtheimia ornata TaxID=688661 RepID=A0AAD7V0L9_9FUNG|nr:uncharacterized protein O0I10_007842 [Lichtheimia ornata]KAJ8656519.1 hypothetical protein O0I10_007842 [Lichtheimia ornata]
MIEKYIDNKKGTSNDPETVSQAEDPIDRSQGGHAFGAYYNIVCAVCGTGMLGLSQAIARGGWGAIALLLLAWWMVSYGSVILIKCLYHPRKQTTRINSFKDITEDAFGKLGGWLCFFFIAWVLLGSPILYLVLIGQNMNQVCRGTAGEIGSIPWTIIWSVIIAIPFVLMKTMKEVAWTSLIGTTACFVSVIMLIVMVGIDSPTHAVNAVRSNIIWEGFPTSLATIGFSMGGNVIYPNVEASMRRPESWAKTVVIALTTCAMLYIVIAVPGYYVYGQDVSNPLYNSITEGPAQTVIIVLVTINILVSVPIFLTSFALDIESMANVTVARYGKYREFALRAAIRISTMVFCTVVACAVPYFDYLMSLFGAFGSCTSIFIIPVLCYWRLTGFKNKSIWENAWCAFILVFGFVGLIFGSWGAITDLIQAFREDSAAATTAS